MVIKHLCFIIIIYKNKVSLQIARIAGVPRAVSSEFLVACSFRLVQNYNVKAVPSLVINFHLMLFIIIH